MHLAPSKGAHVILPAAALGHPRAAVTVPVEGEAGRWVFALPNEDGRVTIGVTDERCENVEREAPSVNPHDVQTLLAAINRAHVRPVQATEVIGRFAGLRPLVAGETGTTADLSRRHVVIEDPDSHALSLVRGKLTTYRATAQDVVDRIAARAGVNARPCNTAKLPLIGAATPDTLPGIAAPARLTRRYGAEAPALLTLASEDPGLLQPIADRIPVLGVELSFAIRHELA